MSCTRLASSACKSQHLAVCNSEGHCHRPVRVTGMGRCCSLTLGMDLFGWASQSITCLLNHPEQQSPAAASEEVTCSLHQPVIGKEAAFGLQQHRGLEPSVPGRFKGEKNKKNKGVTGWNASAPPGDLLLSPRPSDGTSLHTDVAAMVRLNQSMFSQHIFQILSTYWRLRSYCVNICIILRC